MKKSLFHWVRILFQVFLKLFFIDTESTTSIQQRIALLSWGQRGFQPLRRVSMAAPATAGGQMYGQAFKGWGRSEKKKI